MAFTLRYLHNARRIWASWNAISVAHLPLPRQSRPSLTSCRVRENSCQARNKSTQAADYLHGTTFAKTTTKRKGARSPAAALEAKRSRETEQARLKGQAAEVHNVAAYCAAEQYNMKVVASILKKAGYALDPQDTGLESEVIHFQMPIASIANTSIKTSGEIPMHSLSDVFVFPSGTVVAWNMDESRLQGLINGALLAAAINPHPDRAETEDLDYYEDASNDKSAVVGDTIRIGTKAPEKKFDQASPETSLASKSDAGALFEALEARVESHESDVAMTKIAFSSALARSTKVAVLEALLDSYFASTQSLPTLLSSGARLPRHYNRRFILRKTGELLSVRAQLNLTELTDRVPDLFWDTRHELGLEGYFEQTSRALDLNYRIKVLNERVDYAREIADILREELHGRHGVLLEWLIIGLITVEVGFEGWKLLKEQFQGESTEDLTRRWLKAELGEA